MYQHVRRTFDLVEKQFPVDLPVGVIEDVSHDHPVGFSDGVNNCLTGDSIRQEEDQHDHDVEHQLLHLTA